MGDSVHGSQAGGDAEVPPPVVAPQPANSGANVISRFLPKGTTALPTYTGKPNTRSHAAPFLTVVKRVFELSPELTDRHKLTALQLCFPVDSPAGAWFLFKLDSFRTFEDFETAFTERFGASDIDAAYLQRQYRNFKQRPRDSVTAFYFALTEIATRLALAGSRLSDKELSEQFMHGLKPSIAEELFREKLRSNRELKLDELVKLAEDIERTQRRDKPETPDLNAINAKSGTGKWCIFHKKDTHNTDECRTVKKLKAEGKWRGNKSTAKAGGSE